MPSHHEAVMLRIDHLAVCCDPLAEGVAMIESLLRVEMAPGGEHAAMGTHNRLLSLGPDIYLEVIAVNPAAAAPGRPRWFDLDRFHGPPRLGAWICACDGLEAAIEVAPEGSGRPMALTRGDLSWRMAVPPDGKLPYSGCFPALIEWQGSAHPAPRLPDHGLRLNRLTLRHPQPGQLGAALARLLADDRVEVSEAPVPGLVAEIATPHGPVLL